MQIWNSSTNIGQIEKQSLELSAEDILSFEGNIVSDLGLNVKTIQNLYVQDQFPIPLKEMREGYFDDDHKSYWLSGLVDTIKMERVIPNFERLETVLDLGCSTGRVLRHLLRRYPTTSFWGLDLKRSSIDWLRSKMKAENATYMHTSTLPVLPFESNSCDLICGFSVFTHIHQNEESWLLELRRILKPGGKLYLTVMTESLWTEIVPGHVMHTNLTGVVGGDSFTFDKPMPEERVVWKYGKEGDVYSETVFHSVNYLKKNWYPFFKKSQLIPRGHNFQDIVILEK